MPIVAGLVANGLPTNSGASNRMRFPATQKLRLQADFVRVRQEGSRLECGPFVLNALKVPGATTPARIGVVTGKKMLGDAVYRNRMRRVFREIFRLNPQVWPAGWDVVIVPRRSSLEKDYASLERRYLESCARLLRNAGTEKTS
ncbi:MAG: ribonuclease P protein component [Puniceicoccales bacterium]|nr:ribonuclease P protein component [Puniceicoccales bacterium]